MSSEISNPDIVRTIHDVVPHHVLDALGYIPGRNQGSFMFLVEGRVDQIGLAHVFDAREERPNIVVVEVPTPIGSLIPKNWYAGLLDGEPYRKLPPERRLVFHEQIMGIVSDGNRVEETELASFLAAFS